MWTQYLGFKVDTELQADLSRRIDDDRKEWAMGLVEDSVLEFESCKTGLQSDSFWFQDSSPTYTAYNSLYMHEAVWSSMNCKR